MSDETKTYEVTMQYQYGRKTIKITEQIKHVSPTRACITGIFLALDKLEYEIKAKAVQK